MGERTQIEFYDKDVLKNIMGVFAKAPDRVVYFYDDAIQDRSVFDDLALCLRRRLPRLLVETMPVDITSMEDIYDKVLYVIDNSECTIIDLTGGSELMLLAGFKAGAECNAEMVYTDMGRRKVLPLGAEGTAADIPPLSLEDFLTAQGAGFMGNSQAEPRPEDYDGILAVCRRIFRNLGDWKETCGYVQTGMGGSPPGDMYFSYATESTDRTGRWSTPSFELLQVFERHKMIHDLSINQNRVSFWFRDALTRRYLTTYGVWLELWVFIHAKRSGAFDDVRLGAIIDWDARDRKNIVGNEIDVLLSMDSLPVFISCKLREVNTADINELVIAKKRLGGWFSKGVLVGFGVSKATHSGTYLRGLDLGVEMLDKNDVLSGNFQDRLLSATRDYDLVKMKWGRI